MLFLIPLAERQRLFGRQMPRRSRNCVFRQTIIAGSGNPLVPQIRLRKYPGLLFPSACRRRKLFRNRLRGRRFRNGTFFFRGRRRQYNLFLRALPVKFFNLLFCQDKVFTDGIIVSGFSDDETAARRQTQPTLRP